MTYVDLKRSYSAFPMILSAAISDGEGSTSNQPLRNQMTRWQKRGLVVKLTRGKYLLNEHDRKLHPSRVFLANQMYSPSYVSLEYALAHYGLIPERVLEVTSVATKKTFRISNPTGEYSYRHLGVSAFRGFQIVKDENGMNTLLAVPEKAVVDFLYLNLVRTMTLKTFSREMFSASYRFQDVERLSEKRLLALAAVFNNPKLKYLTEQFCRFRKEQMR